jgi:hypothetical protein
MFVALIDVALQLGENIWRHLKLWLQDSPLQLMWAVSLFFVLVGTGIQAVAAQNGWSPGIYRLWYLSILVIPIVLVGQGLIYLAMRRMFAHFIMGFLLVALAIGVIGIFRAQFAILQGLPGSIQIEAEIPAPLQSLITVLRDFGIAAGIGGVLWIVTSFSWNGGSRLRVLVVILATTGILTLSVSSTPGSLQGILPLRLVTIAALFAALILAGRVSNVAPLSPLLLARRRFRIKAVSIGLSATFILGAVALLPVAPLYMGIANARFKSVYIQEVPVENNGVYLVTNQGVMQIYSWSIEPDDYPSDTAVLKASGLQHFVIVSKQFDDPVNYRLYSLTTGQIIPWQSFDHKNGELILNAGPLNTGQYELDTPTDNMFGGHTWQFFTLN